jgi:tetratricopeptide (TPR) repeat protein
VRTLPLAGPDTNDPGRGESAGIESVTSRRQLFRCRRCAGFALVLALACGDDPPAPAPPSTQARTAARAAPAPGRPAQETGAATYYQGYLDETLSGEFHQARASYRRVLDDPAAEPEVAARAALRLAEFEASSGRRHVALDLVARAAALGRGQRDLLTWAQRLQKRIATVRAQDIEVRGPPAGTALDGVSKPAAELFARAEDLLASYHGRRLRPRLEDLRASERSKRYALESAVRAYRQVVALGEPTAVVAAEFRIASLYYDLALSLTFDLPPELDPGAATRWRQSLRAKALSDRNNARKAYLRALEAGRDGRAGDAGAVWLEAAELGLRSVEDLLRRRD